MHPPPSADYEASIRESKSSQDHVDRLQRLHHDENKVLEEAMNVMQLKLNEALGMKEMEYQRRSEVQDTNKELRLTVDKLRGQVDALKIQVVQSDRLRKSEGNLLKQTIKELQQNLADRTRQVEDLSHDLDAAKQSLESTIASSESKVNDEMSIYRQRALDAEKSLREFEETITSSDARAKFLIDKMKESSAYTIDQLESQMEVEREKVRAFAAKANDCDDQIAVLSEENNQLLHVIDEAKGTIAQLQNELEDANEKVIDLTDQVIQGVNKAGDLLSSRSFLPSQSSMTHQETQDME
jgi:chromosome segregation ATPase